jgi:hypothetical protein
MAEGVVVAYSPDPTITVQAEDGGHGHWQTSLPIEVVADEFEHMPAMAPMPWKKPARLSLCLIAGSDEDGVQLFCREHLDWEATATDLATALDAWCQHADAAHR